MDNLKYPMQQCQDVKLNNDFRAFHQDIVNRIIGFCVDHHIMIDEFSLKADDLEESIKCGCWQSTTDSCLTFEKHSQEYKDVTSMKRIASDEEYDRIINEEVPFLISL